MLLSALPLRNAAAQTLSSPADSVELSAAEVADRIVAEAHKYLGTPYRHAGNGPKVFDCTGFTKFIFAKFGYKLGRTVPGQMKDGREFTGALTDLQKGDILIFGARGNKRRPGHAAIFIDTDSTGTDCRVIHAARTGVIVSRLSERYYTERFLGARRILPDFLPEEAPADSALLASLVELISHSVAPRDTLTLSEDDRRIVLFADGTWALVSPDGSLSAPEGGTERIVLRENGDWYPLVASSVRVPDLKETEQAPAQKSSSPPPPPADGSAVYHTIVSGDTLSGIAVKYHTTVNTLCSLNGISRTTTLRVGKKLRVR